MLCKNRILVIGDIHGAYLALKEILRKCDLKTDDLLIFLGDYVDGWSDSPKVLDYLIELQQTHQCVFLQGNHDELLLKWFLKKEHNPLWLKHGGQSTIDAYQDIDQATQSKHIHFLKNLTPYYTDEKNRLFIHAGFTNPNGIEHEYFPKMFHWDRTLWETAIALNENLTTDDVLYPKRFKLFEEIFRVYGYNNVKFSKKVSATMFRAPRTEDTRVQNIIADQLTALGFNEMMANSLTSPEHVKLADYLKEEHNVVLLNPLSNDLSALRQSLLFGGLEAISFNINRKRADIKFFEFGKSYHKIEGEYQENKHLTLLITGTRTPESWATTAQKSSFFQFKSYVLTILERLGIASNNLVPTDKNIFQEGLNVVVNNQTVVSFGTIQKDVLKHFDIKQEVLFADFDWSLVLELLNNKIKSVAIPKYPEVRRDLSLLLDENIEFKTVKELAQKTEKHLLKTINLFDVYQGDKLPEGKKSYAISFILQDVNQTLTDEQIEKIMTNLKNKFEKELQAELR